MHFITILIIENNVSFKTPCIGSEEDYDIFGRSLEFDREFQQVDDEIGVDLMVVEEITDAESPTIPTLISTTDRLPLTSLQV